MTKPKKPVIDNLQLCNNCQYHFVISGCDCCGKCAPSWDTVNGKFECDDYLPKKEVKHEKENM